MILFFYAMLHGACLKRLNKTNKTKQKFLLSNTDRPNKGGGHVSAITKPLNPLLRGTISNNNPSLYSQDRTLIKEVVDQHVEPSINGTKSNKQVGNQFPIHITKSNQEYSANNKEYGIRESENSCFITPELSSSAPQDVALTEEMLTPVNKELADLSDRKIPIKIDGVEFYTKDLLALLHLNGNG
ncbi:MAG: hypothetical protein NMK33_05335 [Candidatus Cardinium sp.]|nr:MAG: hypothetical protein NMK33_05335 [Candidatus Cardinium sp.]